MIIAWVAFGEIPPINLKYFLPGVWGLFFLLTGQALSLTPVQTPLTYPSIQKDLETFI